MVDGAENICKYRFIDKIQLSIIQNLSKLDEEEGTTTG